MKTKQKNRLAFAAISIIALAFFGCKAATEIEKEKETGEPLSISLSKVVNDAQNDATKTSVTVTATIKSASKIKKVAYKQGGSIDAKQLFKESGITEVKADENDETKYTFTVTAKDESANGIYTVAALDVLGREETEQIAINNFDFSGPKRIYANFTYNENEHTVTVTWTDPKDTNEEKKGFSVSGLKNVTVAYKETDKDDTTAKQGTVDASKTETGKNSFTTEALTPNGSYTFTIYSNDNLGNQSEKYVYDNRKASSSITFNVGDIILADGTKVSVYDYDSYTEIDKNNMAVAIIAGFNDKGAALGIGLHADYLSWAAEGVKGCSEKIESIVSTTTAKFYERGEAANATFTGDTDGSDNWEEICKFDPDGTKDEVAEKNYPAFYWANNYGKKYASELKENTTGWYIPSAAELCAVYRNRDEVQKAHKKLYDLYAKIDLSYTIFDEYDFNSCGFSSNQYESGPNERLGVMMSNGYINATLKYNKSRFFVVRAF